jgi:hypothetical protein
MLCRVLAAALLAVWADRNVARSATLVFKVRLRRRASGLRHAVMTLQLRCPANLLTRVVGVSAGCTPVVQRVTDLVDESYAIPREAYADSTGRGAPSRVAQTSPHDLHCQ